jgi:hypothetical protein
MLQSNRNRRTAIAALALLATTLCVSTTFGQSTKPASDKTFFDYYLPTPIIGTLSKDAWGVPQTGPRDQKNGLEDTTIKQWCYWDGKIIKAPDGKYHMFASRWDQSLGHGGYRQSVAVHAVSDNLTGPYIDKGLCYPDNQNGKGHNVTALQLPDGRYAIVVSHSRPGDVFVSKSLDGPWEQLGTIKVNQTGWRPTNICILVRPDGDYEMIQTGGLLYRAKAADGVLGPYEPVSNGSVYPREIGRGEDPVLWYSGGLYHIIYNQFGPRKSYHLTSVDGITNWKSHGLAIDPTRDMIKYTDGTLNHWAMMERPGVYIEDGHVKAITVAAIDCSKNQEQGNDQHGSKIVVMPFDGAALDRDMAAIVAAEQTAAPATQPAR